MKKSLFIFSFLFIYAAAQIVWWGALLLKADPSHTGMIIGEGFIFMAIFLGGSLILRNSVARERETREQQHNFLLSVTHELKSPLASIKLCLQTIVKRDLEIEHRNKFLCNSIKDIERLDDMVGNMLLAARLDVASVTSKEHFNFSEVVSNIAEKLQTYSCTSQFIRSEIDENVQFYGDRNALSAVVSNLIENAIKYSPGCGCIDVTLARDEEHKIKLSIADSGIGITDEEKKKVFNKFYRVGSENTRKTKGTGLGLYIVKSVLEYHNAQIKIKDNKPSGSVFEVTFN